MTEPIVFMGTPEFAVPALRALAGAGYALTVVTQPDRPTGRSGAPVPPAVKQAAAELGLPVLQPPTLRDPAVTADLRARAPAAIVVAAYGEILRPAVLDLPRAGCINLHPSLLPRWRGPTPIPAAILAGDAETGVSIIRMDPGMDSGALLAQERAPILPDDTAAALGARLAEQGAALLVRTLAAVLRGEVTPQPQPAEGVTICRLLHKEDGALDWSAPAEQLDRQVRAYEPWPGTYTSWLGNRLRILAARALPNAPDETPLARNTPPGMVRRVGDIQAGAPAGARRVAVRCGRGWLELLQVQREGKTSVPIAAFLQGYSSFAGAHLG